MFDATLQNQFRVEVTEHYEGDRYHVVIFDNDGDHVDTRGFKTAAQVFNFIRECSEEE